MTLLSKVVRGLFLCLPEIEKREQDEPAQNNELSAGLITEAIHTHFLSAIRAFTQLELMRSEELIKTWYEVQINFSQQERA